MDINLLRKMAGLPTQSATSVTATNSTANEFRKLAGLNPLPIKEDPKQEMVAEEPALPEIVTKIAAKVEGMKGDEIVELIKKVYDAGVADGQAACEEGDVKEGIVDRVKAMVVGEPDPIDKFIAKISKPPQQMRTPEPKPRDTFIDSITNFVSPYGYKRVRSNRAGGIGEWRNPNTGGIIEFNEDPDSMGYIINVRGGGMRGYYWGKDFEKDFQKDFAKLHKKQS